MFPSLGPNKEPYNFLAELHDVKTLRAGNRLRCFWLETSLESDGVGSSSVASADIAHTPRWPMATLIPMFLFVLVLRVSLIMHLSAVEKHEGERRT